METKCRFSCWHSLQVYRRVCMYAFWYVLSIQLLYNELFSCLSISFWPKSLLPTWFILYTLEGDRSICQPPVSMCHRFDGYMVMLVTSFLPVSFVCGLPLAECCNVNVKHPVVSGDWHRCCDSNGETSILHWKVLTFPPACRYIYGWFISTVHCYLCRYWIFNIDLLHIHSVYVYTLIFTVQWEINTWGQVKVSCVSLQSTMLNLTVTSIYIENRWEQVLQSVT